MFKTKDRMKPFGKIYVASKKRNQNQRHDRLMSSRTDIKYQEIHCWKINKDNGALRISNIFLTDKTPLKTDKNCYELLVTS